MSGTSIVTGLWGDWPNGDAALGLRYAHVLKALCERFAPGVDFVCMADRDVPGVKTIDLPPCDYPAWSCFQKLYALTAFPPGHRVLWLDLDTVPVGDITPLLEIPLDKFVGLHDWFAPGVLCCGILSWCASPELASIYKDFRDTKPAKKDSPFFRSETTPPKSECTTDQFWLRNYFPRGAWAAMQTLIAPHKIWGFKHHILGLGPDESVVPKIKGQYAMEKRRPKWSPEQDPDVRVVYFHTKPRPHECPRHWNPIGVNT